MFKLCIYYKSGIVQALIILSLFHFQMAKLFLSFSLSLSLSLSLGCILFYLRLYTKKKWKKKKKWICHFDAFDKVRVREEEKENYWFW